MFQEGVPWEEENSEKEKKEKEKKPAGPFPLDR